MKLLNYGTPPLALESSSALPRAIFLHGFPGVRSKQNRDLAESYAKLTGRFSQVLLYSGLGCADGHFSFQGCVDEVRAFFESLSRELRNQNENGNKNDNEKAAQVDLVGHSWGGFLALLIAHEFPSLIRRMVLMSPVLFFADEERVLPFFEEKVRDNPALTMGRACDLARDFVKMDFVYPLSKFISSLSPHIEILFVQAKDDQTTPAFIAEAMLPQFKRPPVYELVDAEHNFVDYREPLVRRIAEFLS